MTWGGVQSLDRRLALARKLVAEDPKAEPKDVARACRVTIAELTRRGILTAYTEQQVVDGVRADLDRGLLPSGLTRKYGITHRRVSEIAAATTSALPMAEPAPIPGQCRGCACHTRASDFTTDTFGVTVRRAGTCRMDQTTAEDVLAGLGDVA